MFPRLKKVVTKKRLAMAAILFFVIPPIIVGELVALYAFYPGPKQDNETVAVNIPKGKSTREIGSILAEAGVIDDDIRFLVLAKISGYAGRLQAGEFLFETGKRPLTVLRTLATARSIQYSITIPEGLSASEIATIFAEGGWCHPNSFANKVIDKEFIAGLGLPGLDSLEGYLYPDTYMLTRDMRGEADKIIGLMVSRFTKVWSEMTEDLEKKPDRQKTVILASIVEKETGTGSERPLIAGVFRNRLQLGMKLQSDPTVAFGLLNHEGPLTKADLQTPTPYNTYVIPALPAGPICNPGRESMMAVLNPSSTKDLYFVSKNDGTHHFSGDLAEHNNAVQKYQKRKSGENGK
ncbi:MAG TPA: endolytic transglycosylase MltG [Desulfobulbaceae bacterium]|nr:endolytic transglycosylase MltG [Desulfobulbaceae bacterium]